MPLDCGGDSWQGWIFGRYGRAREWRLIAPDGLTFTADELTSLPGLMADADYFRVRVRELESERDSQAVHFTAAEMQTIRSAAAILDRLPALPRLNQKMRQKAADRSADNLDEQPGGLRLVHGQKS